MLLRTTLNTLILHLFIVSLPAQVNNPGQKAVELYKQGEQLLLEKNPEKALKMFEKALSFQPDLTAAYRSMGACYELLNDYEKAREQYRRVLTNDPYFSAALYYQMGEVNYKMGDYEEAMKYFQEFQNFRENDTIRFSAGNLLERQLAEEALEKLPGTIQACRVAMDSLQFVNITEVENMGSGINTKADEYFPFLSNDQKLLFFNRRKSEKNDEDLFFSRKEDGRWSNSNPVGSLNSSKDEGMCTLVRDGRRMFFTACKREGVLGTCDIWQALVEGTEVHSIEALNGYVNSDRWESQAAINCDGSMLYFASNRSGGLGGTDLWYSRRLDDDTWSAPVNLGSDINTEMDEEAPFITNDGKTLYFSSTGHLGMGEQDIFMSWWDDVEEKWSVPINLGPPVNSAYRELGLFLSADGRTGYFSSLRPGGRGGMDIYRFELSQQLYSEPVTYVEGFVRDSIIDIPVPATVKINGRGAFKTDQDGRFFLCVGADEILDTRVAAKGYFPYHNQFVIPEWDNRTFYTIELRLNPTISFLRDDPPPPADSTLVAKRGKVQKEYAHNIFFEFDKYSLSNMEIGRLDDFVGSLNKKDIKRVEIIGFSDDIGEDLYNLKLSEERAKQIALFLIDNKIVVDKIYLEGKGEIKDDRPKEENRRVEIRVYTLE